MSKTNQGGLKHRKKAPKVVSQKENASSPNRCIDCISRTTMWRGINKIQKCFSCPGDCKELSKETERSTYDSNQARTKQLLTRPPTSDTNSLVMRRIRTNETQNVSLNLGDCSGLSNEARRWNQGSSQLTVGMAVAYRHAQSVSLPHEPRIQKQTKKKDTKIPATIQNFRRRQERYRPKQTQPKLSGPFFYDDVGVALLINGCGCGFVHMCLKTSNKILF